MNKNWSIGLGILAVALVGGYGFWWFIQPKVDTSVAVIAPVAPIIAKVDKVDTPVKMVRTYKPIAKTKLKLPPLVIANVDQQVTGATTVAPSERKVTVTSVLDTKTGETTTYSKSEPYSWIPSFESRGEARLDLIYKVDARTHAPQQAGRLMITQDFLQLKAVHLGGTASIDTKGEMIIGVGVGYRW